jgi:hypothetical protein
MKHTPGPWINADGFIHSEATEDRPFICQLHNCFVANDNSVGFAEADNTEANAKLIAAAPELLEALEAIIRIVKPGDKTGWYTSEWIAAEKAIKKATS